MREIALPHGRTTTQLGFGCAYLLGPGLDEAVSRRLLDAAYDAGIRHFDTARMYGKGYCEALLSPFLRAHPDATVATKYGFFPNSKPVRIARAIGRRLPLVKRLVPDRPRKAKFTRAEAAESLEISLRMLGRESIDLYLLHEPSPEDLERDDLHRFLEDAKAAGKVGEFGMGTERGSATQIYERFPQLCPVVQCDWDLTKPPLDFGPAFLINYRALGPAASTIEQWFRANPEIATAWSKAVDQDLAEPKTLLRILLKASLQENPEAMLLVSSSREEHIRENCMIAASEDLADPADRLARLIAEQEPNSE